VQCLVEEECLDNNPALKVYRSIKNNKEEPIKQVANGLASRNNKQTKAGKPDPSKDVAMRVARYVNDIRNYNA
jgi:hypothetical protein